MRLSAKYRRQMRQSTNSRVTHTSSFRSLASIHRAFSQLLEHLNGSGSYEKIETRLLAAQRKANRERSRATRLPPYGQPRAPNKGIHMPSWNSVPVQNFYSFQEPGSPHVLQPAAEAHLRSQRTSAQAETCTDAAIAEPGSPGPVNQQLQLQLPGVAQSARKQRSTAAHEEMWERMDRRHADQITPANKAAANSTHLVSDTRAHAALHKDSGPLQSSMLHLSKTPGMVADDKQAEEDDQRDQVALARPDGNPRASGLSHPNVYQDGTRHHQAQASGVRPHDLADSSSHVAQAQISRGQGSEYSHRDDIHRALVSRGSHGNHVVDTARPYAHTLRQAPHGTTAPGEAPDRKGAQSTTLHERAARRLPGNSNAQSRKQQAQRHAGVSKKTHLGHAARTRGAQPQQTSHHLNPQAALQLAASQSDDGSARPTATAQHHEPQGALLSPNSSSSPFTHTHGVWNLFRPWRRQPGEQRAREQPGLPPTSFAGPPAHVAMDKPVGMPSPHPPIPGVKDHDAPQESGAAALLRSSLTVMSRPPKATAATATHKAETENGSVAYQIVEEYLPTNVTSQFAGVVTARTALMHSLNAPAVALAYEVGLENGAV
jgi:hypothetical protein